MRRKLVPLSILFRTFGGQHPARHLARARIGTDLLRHCRNARLAAMSGRSPPRLPEARCGSLSDVTPTVRYDPHDDAWFFGERRRSYDGAYSLVIKRNDLFTATATDLARALRKARQCDAEPEAVLIDLAPDDQYSPKESVVDPISFTLLDDGRLAVGCALTSDDYIGDDTQLHATVTPLIEPLLRRLKAQLATVQADAHRSTAPYFQKLSSQPPPAGRL
jgi:hypothetical protein